MTTDTKEIDPQCLIKINARDEFVTVQKIHMMRSRKFAEWDKKAHTDTYFVNKSAKDFRNMIDYLSGMRYELTENFKLLADELDIDFTEEMKNSMNKIMNMCSTYEQIGWTCAIFYPLNGIENIITDQIVKKLEEKKSVIEKVTNNYFGVGGRNYLYITLMTAHLIKIGWFNKHLIHSTDNLMIFEFQHNNNVSPKDEDVENMIDRLKSFNYTFHRAFNGTYVDNKLYSTEFTNDKLYIVLSSQPYFPEKYVYQNKNENCNIC